MRLNLGCGGQIMHGWVNVDRAWSDRTSHCTTVDLVKDEWPWEPESCDGAVLHHVVDLFTPDEVIDVLLPKLVRVMKSGALVRVSSADLIAGVQAALAGDTEWFVEQCWSDPGVLDFNLTVGHFITQNGARKSFWTPLLLCAAFTAAGFDRAMHSAPHTTLGPPWLAELDSRASESWFVEAVR